MRGGISGYGPPSLFEGWDAIWGESLPEEGGLDGIDGPAGFLYPGDPRRPRDDAAFAPGRTGGADSSPEAAESPVSSREAIDALRSLNEKYVEATILKFNVAIAESGAATMEIETRLRSPEGEEAATIEACLAELVKDSESYLAEQDRLAEQFRQRMGELGDMASVGEEVEMANLAAAAIGNDNQQPQADGLPFGLVRREKPAVGGTWTSAGGPAASSRQSGRCVSGRGEVATTTRPTDPRIGRDPLTGLPNRIGLEIALEQWWRKGRPQSRQIGAILLDVNAFGKLNGHYGSAVGERLLPGLSQVQQELCGPGRLLARYAAQRFAVVMLDAGPNALRKTAELLRQSIERTVFTLDAEKISIAVSGGVAALESGDTVATLLARAERAWNTPANPA